MKRIFLGLLMLAGLIAPAHATCTLPYQLQNGKIADANQVMANMNAIVACIVDQGPGGLNDQVQYNNFGAFGGLTDVALTARIQPFTASLNGAVPAPITTSGNCLKDNGTWGSCGGGGGSCPAGTAGQFQYTDGASCQATSDVLFDSGTGFTAENNISVIQSTGAVADFNVETATGSNSQSLNVIARQGFLDLESFLGVTISASQASANVAITTNGGTINIEGTNAVNCPGGITAGTVTVVDGLITHC